MNVAIVKYNAGNTASVANAVRRCGIEPMITDDPKTLTAADKVIFPGVGEASTAMRYLNERGLDETIRGLKQPVLAICLGMQLLCMRSDENDTACLGLLPFEVRRFSRPGLKVPHVGWARIQGLASPLFDGVDEGSYVYFVHGYYVQQSPDASAISNHGVPFTAAVTHENFHAVQFHPEKSGSIGRRIMENFLSL